MRRTLIAGFAAPALALALSLRSHRRTHHPRSLPGNNNRLRAEPTARGAQSRQNPSPS